MFMTISFRPTFQSFDLSQQAKFPRPPILSKNDCSLSGNLAIQTENTYYIMRQETSMTLKPEQNAEILHTTSSNAF